MSFEHDFLPGCTCCPIACWVIRCHARQITRGLCLSVFFVPLFLWPLVSWTVPIPPIEGALCIDFLLPSISFFEALATLTKPTWATCYRTSMKTGPATTSSTSTSYWRVSTPVVWQRYQHLQVLFLSPDVTEGQICGVFIYWIQIRIRIWNWRRWMDKMLYIVAC